MYNKDSEYGSDENPEFEESAHDNEYEIHYFKIYITIELSFEFHTK